LDITSLARRFEIPRDRLNELKELAQNDAPAAFQRLQAVLEEFGISQSLLAEQAKTTAVQYEKLGGAAKDALATVGQLLGQALEPAAVKLTTVLTNVAQGLEQFAKGGDKKLDVEKSFLTASASAEDFNQRVVAANNIITESFQGVNIGILAVIPGAQKLADTLSLSTAAGLKFDQVTQGQFEFLTKLQQGGASIQTIATAMRDTSGAAQELERAWARSGSTIQGTKAQFDSFSASMLLAQQRGGESASIADAFFEAIVSGSESVPEATARLDAYLEATRQANVGALDGSDAHERAAAGILQETDALSASAVEAINAETASAQLKARQEEIYQAALLAATGMGASGNAASAMASQFGIAESAAAALIEQLRDLKIAQNLSAATNATESNFVAVNALAGRAVDLNAFRQGQKAVDDLNDALRDQKFQAADAAGKIRLLKDELGKLNPGTAEYIRKQTEIDRAEEALEKKRNKRGTSPKLTANEKINAQLLAQQDKFSAKAEDLEKSHQQKLLDIVTEFGRKQLEQQNENEKSKRRSRFDFYSDLNKSDLTPVDKQKFAAAYEEAFAEAQRIAQSGRAKLAQEFLALKQSHLKELQDLAAEEQSIKSDKETSKGEKQAQLANLEERKRLLADAQREEEQQLLNGGDAIQNELNKRLADENQAYEEQADKIATAADRAGDAKVKNAERHKIVVDAENKALADQVLLYDKIAAKNGGQVPTSPLAPSTTNPAAAQTQGTNAQPAAITAPDSIPVKADAPLPVQAPDVLTVKQLDLFTVRDQGVIDAIGDQTSRLEGKLDGVAAQIGSTAAMLGSKLDSVRSAVASSNRTAIKP